MHLFSLTVSLGLMFTGALAAAQCASTEDEQGPEERVLEEKQVLAQKLADNKTLKLRRRVVEYPFDVGGRIVKVRKVTCYLDLEDAQTGESRRVWHKRVSSAQGDFSARDFTLGVRDENRVAIAHFVGMLIFFEELDVNRTAPPLRPKLRARKDFDPTKVRRLQLEGNPNLINTPSLLRVAGFSGNWNGLPKLVDVRWRNGEWEVAVEMLAVYKKTLADGRVLPEDRKETHVFVRKAETGKWELK